MAEEIDRADPAEVKKLFPNNTNLTRFEKNENDF